MVKIYEHQRRNTTGKKRTGFLIADYTSGVRRWHNLKVVGSNPAPATIFTAMEFTFHGRLLMSIFDCFNQVAFLEAMRTFEIQMAKYSGWNHHQLNFLKHENRIRTIPRPRRQTGQAQKWPTRIKPFYKSKDDYNTILETHIQELNERQSLLYADNRYSLLLIFQAMDAAGKDGAIKHVMSGVNPQGCQVFSFKHPSAGELEHDFLWRTTRCLPERGRIGIFNRSYYEEVLIVRVHPEILRGENLPEEPAKRS